MKKILVIFLVLLSAIKFQAQSNQDFRQIDEYALKAPRKVSTSIIELSKYLTVPYEKDWEKVRSIFTWLMYNVEYDYKAYKAHNQRINKTNEDVLKRKKAVCFGYAKLFEALCEAANIKAEVVSGFSKGKLSSIKKLGEPDHAWNAVKINGDWHLLDVTWASNIGKNKDDLMEKFETTYFLTSPKVFIFNHLPSDPMWQLLDCVVTPEIFKRSFFVIEKHFKTAKHCIDYRDTLVEYETKKGLERRLISKERAYRFYPTTQTAKEYAHTLMDYQGELSETAEALQGTDFLDSLISIQKEMIQLCEKAANLTTLFPNQLESWAYIRMNYAVALSQKINSVNAEEQFFLKKTMKTQTLEAQKTLEQLPKNFMIEGALERCQQILEYLK